MDVGSIMYLHMYYNIIYTNIYIRMCSFKVYHPWHQFSTSDLPIGMISSVVIAMIWITALAFIL